MKREYPENRTRFTAEEDDMLRTYSATGYTCSQIAEALDRPVGSIYTRRRLLGIGKKRGPRAEVSAADENPVIVNPMVDELIGRIAFYSFAGALALAAVYAIAGGW